MKKLSLNKRNFSKWFENQKLFLKPLIVLYLAYSIRRVSDDGLAPNDFLPNNDLLTAGALYLLNAAYDYWRKLK